MSTPYRLGKNADENSELFTEATQTDWWFHLDSLPSAHAYVADSDMSREVVREVAEALRENSKYRNLPKLRVVYTQKKNLRRGNKPGEVCIVSNKRCKYTNAWFIGNFKDARKVGNGYSN